uniref:Uncharacterized protein n=1 Tax=Cannabis sativa TaxID=3483 RepID=A0A803QRC0_CANSA
FSPVSIPGLVHDQSGSSSSPSFGSVVGLCSGLLRLVLGPRPCPEVRSIVLFFWVSVKVLLSSRVLGFGWDNGSAPNLGLCLDESCPFLESFNQ